MYRSITLLSLAAGAFANTQLPFFWPGFDSNSSDGGVNPVASVITVSKATTVVQMACPTGIDSNDCGWGNGEITYTLASSSVYAAALSTDGISVSFGCTSKNAMTCVMAVPASEFGDLTSGMTGIGSGGVVTVTTTVDSAPMQTMTVTAGEDKLKATGAASAGSTLATSASGTAASGSKAGATAASATGSGSPAQSTGAAARFGVEGAALFALAGAAALNVL